MKLKLAYKASYSSRALRHTIGTPTSKLVIVRHISNSGALCHWCALYGPQGNA